MGFRGFWFNNSQQFNTNKHPHCYIGTINKLVDVIWGSLNNITDPDYSTVWGLLNNITDPNYNTVWGDYGGDEVIRSALGFNNLGGGFAIENLWHKLPGIYTAEQSFLYDANGKLMNDPKYVIDIYYKLILPSSYESNKDEDLVMFTTKAVTYSGSYSYRDSTLDKLKDVINGVPTMYDNYNQPHCIITGTSPKGYLALPEASTLGYDSKAPVGTDLVNLTATNDTIWSTTSDDYYSDYRNTFRATGAGGNYSLSNATFLNSSRQTTENSSLMLTSVNYSNGLVHYGINTSKEIIGVPFKAHSYYKPLMPSLFTGYILQNNFLNRYLNDATPNKALTGALYICLGISKI